MNKETLKKIKKYNHVLDRLKKRGVPTGKDFLSHEPVTQKILAKSEYDILPKWMPAEQRLRPRKVVTHV